MRIFIINWYGAYTFQELEYVKELGNGIYLITGKQKYERIPKIQYCGITEGSFYSRIKNHHKKDSIYTDQNFWLGRFSYPKEVTRNTLETAEKMLVYSWQFSLNEKKKLSLPEPTTVLNYWFNRNHEPRFNQQKIYRDFSDVISWDGELWRLGNLKVSQE